MAEKTNNGAHGPLLAGVVVAVVSTALIGSGCAFSTRDRSATAAPTLSRAATTDPKKTLPSRSTGSPNAYRTAISEAQQAGLHVYWVGPPSETADEFNVIEAEFHGGVVGVDANSVDLHYFREPGVARDLDVFSIAKTDWASIDEIIHRSNGARRTSSTTRVILGREAQVVTERFGNLPRLEDNRVNAFWISIDMDDVVVLAEAHSLQSTSGTEANPLVQNPERLFALLETLRPCPQ
jgi:hypothetical protein